MELLHKNKEWFLSGEGEKAFFALSSLEERTMFFYSYLKTAVKDRFDKGNTLFKMAFFFADAIYTSETPYSQFPTILDADSNPFLQYLENADKFYGNEITYMIFTAILQEKVNVTDMSEWIYDGDFLKSEDLWDKLLDKGIEYLPPRDMYMVDPKSYKTKETDAFLQLEIVWMFLK